MSVPPRPSERIPADWEVDGERPADAPRTPRTARAASIALVLVVLLAVIVLVLG